MPRDLRPTEVWLQRPASYLRTRRNSAISGGSAQTPGAALYICLCNALTVRQVEHAVQCGARRPKDVYEAAGAKAECGSCTGSVLCLMRKLLANDDAVDGQLAAAD